MEPEVPAAPRRRGNAILIAIIVLLTLGAGGGAYWFAFVRGLVSTDDARIDGTLVDAAPQIGGTLAAVDADEGDSVRKGEPLFQLVTSTLEADLARARNDSAAQEASLQMARAKLDLALHGPRPEDIAIARTARQQAESELGLAKIEWDRIRTLADQNTVTASERDRALTRFESDSLALRQATEKLSLLTSGTRPEDIDAARAAVKLAEAQVAASKASVVRDEIALSQATVDAPFNGVIVRRWRDPGATVAPGTAVLTVLDPKSLYVSANIEEKYLSDIAIGDRVNIDVDAYPNLKLKGRVSSIMRATNSTFSLIPAQGVSGTFIKVSQRVPIKIALDSIPPVGLGPGMSVEIEIRMDSNKP